MKMISGLLVASFTFLISGDVKRLSFVRVTVAAIGKNSPFELASSLAPGPVTAYLWVEPDGFEPFELETPAIYLDDKTVTIPAFVIPEEKWKPRT